MTGRRPWRRCPSCFGICHWHDEAWVCDSCGDEWFKDHDPKRFGAPGGDEVDLSSAFTDEMGKTL